jgi:GNAT superfamily N-acetyltransferase
MNEEQYEAFLVLSMHDQMQDQVQAGTWRAEEAEANMARMVEQFLPEGLATPNHFFFAIEEEGSGTNAGGLWYVLAEDAGTRQFFVMDIQVYEEYRRRGYGTQAFREMEDKAREVGVGTISLHVFEHNHTARALYEKLGYAGTGTAMAKDLS